MDKRAKQHFAPLQRTAMPTGDTGESDRFGARKVRQRVHLEVAEDVFDGIQLGRVRRQQDAMESTVCFGMGGDGLAAMGRQTIPHQDDGRLHATGKFAQEGDQQRRGDIGGRIEPKEESYPVASRTDAQRGNDADLPVRAGALMQQRRLPARAPAAAGERRHQEARLVEKNQGRPQARGVFFTRGQRSFTHCWMATSSRSIARRSGFWGLQPNACRSLPT